MTRADCRIGPLLFLAAGIAGYVDAVGLLTLGGSFVAFMSGNTTRFAIGMVRYGPMAATALIVIAFFVAGVVAGALVAGGAGKRRGSAVLLLAAGMLLPAALPVPARLLRFEHLLVLVAVPAAMGVGNSALPRDDGNMGAPHPTGTLVGLGQQIAAALRGRDRLGWLPYLLTWLALVWGAIAGAALYPFAGRHGLLLASIAYLPLAFARRRQGGSDVRP